jgi:hypothetical protein
MKDELWKLHLFPGGYVGCVKSRFGVYCWLLLNCWRLREKRAIHTGTKEHIVW